MKEERLISICIPTCRRPDILRETLNSIFSQGVDCSIFNVCISDNSDTDETLVLLQTEFSDIKNLVYNRSNCVGFLNSIEALKLGTGKLLKLHNDYSRFYDQSLQKLIDTVRKYENTKSMLFFSMHALKNKNKINEFDSFNDFMNNISFFSTWSTSFAIWKSDFDVLMASGIDVDFMFPHTTLLFELTKQNKYVVDDYEYVENLLPKKKGGYNLINNFVVIYMTMVKRLLKDKHISMKTFRKVENGILNFSANWYSLVLHSDNYTFTFENKNKLIISQCGYKGIYKFYIYYFYNEVKRIAKKMLKK